MNVGQSVVIKAELHADENLVLDGRVEGQIDLPRHALTIGAGAHIQADIVAKTLVVIGSVAGRVTVLERVDLQAGSTLEGHLTTPKLVVAEGACFNGTVEMPALGGGPVVGQLS